jgi:D-lactate dehydrogenase (cytochrome)
MNKISAELNLSYGFLSHAGDGNLHPNFFVKDPEDAELMSRVYEGGRRLAQLFVELGGTITGEHGIGIEKREYLTMMYSLDELVIMKEIKGVFDPENRLNPGKIFPAEIPSTPQDLPEILQEEPTDVPSTIEESSDLIRSWYKQNLTIGIRGGNTKPTTLFQPEKLFSTKNLQGIQSFTPEELTVTVLAGTTLSELNARLSKDEMKIPFSSPWEDATIGGILASNFNAPLRLRYGSIRDLVQALKVVLPDGRILKAGRPLMKDVAGYDMKKLFIGSHGTLGVITEVSIKIAPIPRASWTLALPFERIEDGLRIGSELLKTSLVASSILLCHKIENPDWKSRNILLYSLEGSQEDVEAEILAVRGILQNMQIEDPDRLSVSGTDLWANWIKGNVEDDTLLRVGIPPKTMHNLFLSPIKEELENSAFMYDLPHGLIYAKGITDLPALRQEISQFKGYATVINPNAMLDGNLDVWGYQPQSIKLMQAIKSKWDPKDLLNPNHFLV